MYTATDAAMIARSGGGLDLRDSSYTATDAAMIARSASSTGARIIFRLGAYTAKDAAMIGRAGGGCVMFAPSKK